jgi:hypothetical protein
MDPCRLASTREENKDYGLVIMIMMILLAARYPKAHVRRQTIMIEIYVSDGNIVQVKTRSMIHMLIAS